MGFPDHTKSKYDVAQMYWGIIKEVAESIAGVGS
jgi:hypothetical protein